MCEGAEFTLNDLMRCYPDLVDETSISGLYARAAGILVRKGNPKVIQKFEDLTRNATQIVVAIQENVQEVCKRVAGIHDNRVMPARSGLDSGEGMEEPPGARCLDHVRVMTCRLEGEREKWSSLFILSVASNRP
ncbi:MAG TPA: hypothetical protein VK463_07055 [Desulfomonilaceae bacterium]|nr:hypothetical protein [Desulfomonilaceae bacterium]